MRISDGCPTVTVCPDSEAVIVGTQMHLQLGDKLASSSWGDKKPGLLLHPCGLRLCSKIQRLTSISRPSPGLHPVGRRMQPHTIPQVVPKVQHAVFGDLQQLSFLPNGMSTLLQRKGVQMYQMRYP